MPFGNCGHWRENTKSICFAFTTIPPTAPDSKICGRFAGQFDAEFLPGWQGRLHALQALVSGMPFTIGFFASAQMAARVREAVATRGYDAVFAYSSSMAQYASLFPGPRIIDLVDIDSDKWAQYGARPSLCSFLWRTEARRLRAYEREIANTFSRTVVCTEVERQLLDSTTREIGVLVHPVDIDRIRIDAEVTAAAVALQPYILFSGSMDYRPNIDAAVYFATEVFPQIRTSRPDLRFVIAGRNPAPAVCRLARDPAIHVTGAVEDMAGWLRGAAVAVAPLRIARGVQNKVMEAMAMARPVVATPNVARALPATVQAELTVAHDRDAFAQAVLQLAGQRKEEARNAVLEAYSEHSCDRRLYELFAATVNASAPARVN